MNWLRVVTDDNRMQFFPGDTVTGSASWRLDQPASLEVRLFWHTKGKGTEDVGLVDKVPLDSTPLAGSQQFRFQLPEGPYSFSGKLISLMWSLELVASSGEADRIDIVLSPTGAEILLPQSLEDPKN